MQHADPQTRTWGMESMELDTDSKMCEKHAWGYSWCLDHSEGCRLDYGVALHGYSSLHKHTHADNCFLCLKGKMHVLWSGGGRTLESGEMVMVPCDTFHRIVFPVATRFVEWYNWEPGEMWDILRHDQGSSEPWSIATAKGSLNLKNL